MIYDQQVGIRVYLHICINQACGSDILQRCMRLSLFWNTILLITTAVLYFSGFISHLESSEWVCYRDPSKKSAMKALQKKVTKLGR